MRARENPFRTERLERLAFRAALPPNAGATALDAIHARWTALGRRAAVVGPHGSGKTTLLRALAARAEREGFRVERWFLNAESARPSAAALVRTASRLGPRDLLCFDGAGHLGPLAWRRVRRAARAAGGVLATAHAPGLLPTLHETRTDTVLLESLVRELVDADTASLRPLLAELFTAPRRQPARRPPRALRPRRARRSCASACAEGPRARGISFRLGAAMHHPLRILSLAALLASLSAPAFAGDGFVSEASARRAALRYLKFATDEVQPRQRAERDRAHGARRASIGRYTAPAGAVAVEDWDPVWDKLDHLRDTRDFDALYLLNALLGYEDDPYLSPAHWERIRTSLLEFKMWFTDPTPAQPDPAEPERDWDDSYYWSENHQILFHTIEYLAGQRFPEACFFVRGLPRTKDCSGEGEMTGAEHMARARGFIDRWMAERWEAGYAEWLSNVYYQKDLTPLLTLAEFAADEELATRASILLDALLLEIGTHHVQEHVRHDARALVHEGQVPRARTRTRGTSASCSSARGRRPATSRAATRAPRSSRARSAIGCPRRSRTRRTICRPAASLTRQSYALDELAPQSRPSPRIPRAIPSSTRSRASRSGGGSARRRPGRACRSPCSAPTATTSGARARCGRSASLRDLLGEPPDLALGQELAANLARAASLQLLSEANTYTWRQKDFMLSTVQDWRKGRNAAQVHAWQATLGEDAIVFTHASREPRAAALGVDRPRRGRARLLDGHRLDAALRAVRERRHPPLLAGLPAGRLPRLLPVPADDARLLPARPLRHGGEAGPLDDRAEGQLLRRALLVARRRLAGVHEGRAGAARERPAQEVVRPRRARRRRQRLDRRAGAREGVRELRDSSGMRSRRRA